MKLEQLLKNIDCQVFCGNQQSDLIFDGGNLESDLIFDGGNPQGDIFFEGSKQQIDLNVFNNLEIEDLFFDGRKTTKNGLFFCLGGANTSGENFVFQAKQNGAVAVVCTKKLNIDLPQIVVKNTRQAMAQIAANFYGNPQKKLKIVGITGTSGKTSCSWILSHILKANAKKVGIIGTSGIFFGNKKLPATMTTPDSIQLFNILSQMVANKTEYVVMEVSAHAIYFDKVFGIDFVVKAITNIKQDHLDFFKTETMYQQTKLDFFKTGNKFVVFGDDKVCEQIKDKNKNKTICFGEQPHNDVCIKNQVFDICKTRFDLLHKGKSKHITTFLLGKYNIFNVALAMCVAGILLGGNFKTDFKNLKILDGRMQKVECDFCNIIIDYAHTTDSLQNFLSTIKQLSSGKNIIVFGCPGERDAYKRQAMGKIAGEHCDVVIVTTDNPASENARRIMWEIACGVKTTKAKCYFVENRKTAIKKALQLANANTNVLIVGKGCENCQIVGDRKLPYNDFDTVERLIKK